MVIQFPAAATAHVPISALLTRCISFLEGFEDDPKQGVTPLLTQLRNASASELITLLAPVARPFRHFHAQAMSTNRTASSGGFTFMRHADGCNGRWRWQVTRIDDTSHAWTTDGFAVVDDFGNLFEVPA